MPPGWCSLFDLSELLMPSLDERLDLPAHGRRLRKNSDGIDKAIDFNMFTVEITLNRDIQHV